MTYAQLESNLIIFLEQLYDMGESATIANCVLEDLTGNNRQQRRHLSADFTPEFIDIMEEMKKQFLQHKPVQYVLGYSWFCGMKFLVNESVLIPRPETEELIEWIVNNYKNVNRALQILDIGSGSGCIPVALKKKLPFTTISSMDISIEALSLANKNAEINKTQIEFQQLNFLDEFNWPLLGKYDVVVSNPPYIPIHEKARMDKNIIGWEPELALFVPDNDPLLFYKKIAVFGKTHLLEGGVVFMETHQHYAGAVLELFTALDYTAVVKKDINGNDRIVRAEQLIMKNE